MRNTKIFFIIILNSNKQNKPPSLSLKLLDLNLRKKSLQKNYNQSPRSYRFPEINFRNQEVCGKNAKNP